MREKKISPTDLIYYYYYYNINLRAIRLYEGEEGLRFICEAAGIPMGNQYVSENVYSSRQKSRYNNNYPPLLQRVFVTEEETY